MAKKEKCEDKKAHGPHEWTKGKVFRRDCPGRKKEAK